MLILQIALGVVLGAVLLRFLNRVGSPSVAAKTAVQKTGNIFWRAYRGFSFLVLGILAVAFVVGMLQGAFELITEKRAPTATITAGAPRP